MFDGISEICDFDKKSGFCPPKVKNLIFVRNVLFRLRITKMKTTSHSDHPLLERT